MSHDPCGKCLVCTAGIPVTCAETERAIRADERRLLGVLRPSLEAARVGREVLAWIADGGHVEVQRAMRDERARRAFGRLVHSWSQDDEEMTG